MSVTPLFVPAVTALEGLVPRDGILDADELEAVARSIAARPDLWEPLAHEDSKRRRYELFYEDERMDAWVLSWMPGQGTGFHDHHISSVGLCVARGTVREEQLRYGMPPLEQTLHVGASRCGNPSYVHRIQSEGDVPAVTIHVYSPRLDWVGQYRIDEDGVVRREVQPGRSELKAQLVAAGARPGVLEGF